MPVLTVQERNITIFLISTALIGSIIGLFRHNWVNNPEILLSHKNMPSYIIKTKEDSIIALHKNSMIEKTTLLAGSQVKSEGDNTEENTVQTDNGNGSTNKTKSNKKKTTQNPSGIININSASKEEFMLLPYIGEVKAGRIMEFRNKNGSFESIKDLEKVKGIGPKTLAKLEPFITI